MRNIGEQPHENSVLWNTMIAPFTRQTFRGVVFYQGESNALKGQNAEAAASYACAIRALIADWRPVNHYIITSLPLFLKWRQTLRFEIYFAPSTDRHQQVLGAKRVSNPE